LYSTAVGRYFGTAVKSDRRRLSQAVRDRVFVNEKSTDIGYGLNSDSDGCFSRQQLFEIRSRFRQPNPSRDRRLPTKQFLRFAVSG
jgi:hypothetical protein